MGLACPWSVKSSVRLVRLHAQISSSKPAERRSCWPGSYETDRTPVEWPARACAQHSFEASHKWIFPSRDPVMRYCMYLVMRRGRELVARSSGGGACWW